jgi:hypothetical protein
MNTLARLHLQLASFKRQNEHIVSDPLLCNDLGYWKEIFRVFNLLSLSTHSSKIECRPILQIVLGAFRSNCIYPLFFF